MGGHRDAGEGFRCLKDIKNRQTLDAKPPAEGFLSGVDTRVVTEKCLRSDASLMSIDFGCFNVAVRRKRLVQGYEFLSSKSSSEHAGLFLDSFT